MDEVYAGIDLHSNNNVIVVTDAEDRVLYRKRLPNSLEAVLGALAPFGARVSGVVVESTYNWYWLVDGLMEHGYCLHLANTTAIQQYSGLKHADDHSDARWLATLLRLNILPEGYIYPCEERPVRDLLRRRSFFVKQSVSNGLSIQNIVARNTGRTLNANGVRKLTDDMADDLLVQPDIALAVKCGLTVMRCAQEQIKLLENAVLKRARLQDEFKLLTSISGIGKILAMTIMLEVGTIRRFPTVGDFASYCRCVDSNHTSNNKKKGQGNSKNGNAYLGWAFVEAANFAIRYDPVIQKYYQRKNARSKHRMIALKTIAHKLARASYHILRDQTPFDAARCFGR